MLHLFDDLTTGAGTPNTLTRIEALARTMRLASLCDLGRTAANPVLSTLRYFRDEYLVHVEQRACPAGICRDLTVYEIVAERCNGCQACVRACPADAVSGQRKAVHAIAAERCIACGACYDACPSQAVRFHPRVEAHAERTAA
jgi:NADH-quinone oxidoreductase subunit F/NADP-reducing hydrogenase subunit HndC